MEETINTPQNEAPQQNNAPQQPNKVFSILGYIGGIVPFSPAFLFPLLGDKSEKGRFHANQTLVLFICLTGLWILIKWIINHILVRNFVWEIAFHSGAIYWIYLLFQILFWVAWIFLTVISIIGMVAASKGECKELPLIGKIKILK